MANSNTHNSHHEFADTHSGGPKEKKSSTANSVNELTTDNGHDSIHDIGNNPVGRKKDDKKENKNRHSGLRIYVMMKGLEIPACLKNVYKDLVSRQLHQLDERGPTVP